MRASLYIKQLTTCSGTLNLLINVILSLCKRFHCINGFKISETFLFKILSHGSVTYFIIYKIGQTSDTVHKHKSVAMVQTQDSQQEMCNC